jgi:indole-3-glycerol phosphate synthase
VSDFLTNMAEASAHRAGIVRETVGERALEERAAAAPPPHPLSFAPDGFDLIAEAKLSSPSEGALVTGPATAERVVDLASTYAAHGAVAISVLTEPARFDGDLEHLRATAHQVELPVMRKDFLVDPIQVLEARAAGASGVLLIATLLPGELLVEMTDLSLELGMFVLVEVFDRSDLQNAVKVFDREVLVGVNSRDLTTLEVDSTRFETLAPHLPDHLPAVAESGIGSPGEAAFVADLGYRLALVGSSLVRDPDPGALLLRMLSAGRDVVRGVA